MDIRSSRSVSLPNKRRICVILFAGLVLLNLFDMVSTSVLLGAGFEEINPVLRAAMDRIGTSAALIVIKLTVLFWIASLLWRGKTEKEWNSLIKGLAIAIVFYGTIMILSNTQAMALLIREGGGYFGV